MKEEEIIFKEHKLDAFTQTVGALPDAPKMTAAELKARFDACPEELRAKHNAACDAAEQLATKVDGIVTESFGGAVEKEMLAPALRDELEGKAEESAVQDRLDAEKAAREALGALVAAKCEVVFGFYTGDRTASQFINLGFTPQAVLILERSGKTAVPDDSLSYYGGLALRISPAGNSADYGGDSITIVENGFTVYDKGDGRIHTNSSYTYNYIAFR